MGGGPLFPERPGAELAEDPSPSSNNLYAVVDIGR